MIFYIPIIRVPDLHLALLADLPEQPNARLALAQLQTEAAEIGSPYIVWRSPHAGLPSVATVLSEHAFTEDQATEKFGGLEGLFSHLADQLVSMKTGSA